jgi:predicted dehydrogenase
MTTRPIGIIVDGATSRIATQMHLMRSLLPIRREGGLLLSDGTRLMPEPVLLGRNAGKLAALAQELGGGLRWSTDTDACLGDPALPIYFDASFTGGRVPRARAAIAAGKHVYLEKPIANTLADALDLARAASKAGVKHGVVQDKLGLPGLAKLVALKEQGFFGRILSARLDFGWWVFDGTSVPAQRPSWNYKEAEGGGLVSDMMPHWRYITEALMGPITAVSARIATRQGRRIDEQGRAFDVDVEDEVFAHFAHAGDVLTQVSASWATRARGDDLLTVRIDGTAGSAVAGMHRCVIQPMAATGKPHFDIDKPRATSLNDDWLEVPDVLAVKNGYRRGWEMFLRHVAEGTPTTAPLIAGAKHLQLADACLHSHRERRWIDLEPLEG